MPNEVFLRTRAGLSTMVSSRAAGRILEGALRGSGHDPDDVNQSQMRSALLGPVLQELENVLPRDGLRRNLERLAKSLREPNGENETARALLTGSIPATVVPPDPDDDGENAAESEGAARFDEPGAVNGSDTGAPTAVNGSDSGAPAAVNGSDTGAPAALNGSDTGAPAAHPPGDEPEVPASPSPAGPFDAYAGLPARERQQSPAAQQKRVTPRLLRRLGDDELDEKITRFALIDNVRLVAAVRADGSVPVFRGEGLDLELLSRLSRLASGLLSKGGDLRSLHLGHSLGQLFLFPIGPDLLIVYGGSDLNLGSVTTAFTALALEEEL